MALKVTVDHPDFPKGTVFGINGLGQFENGKAREVSEEEELSYLQENGVVAREGLKGSPTVKVEGTATVKQSALPEVDDAVFIDTEGGDN